MTGEGAETESTPAFQEKTDKFGSALTEITFTDGEFGTLYRSFGFTPDCSCAENAVRETDARGSSTEYTVNEDTSRLVTRRLMRMTLGVCMVAEDTSVCGIAAVNPFRYLGYYYDVEIGRGLHFCL